MSWKIKLTFPCDFKVNGFNELYQAFKLQNTVRNTDIYFCLEICTIFLYFLPEKIWARSHLSAWNKVLWLLSLATNLDKFWWHLHTVWIKMRLHKTWALPHLGSKQFDNLTYREHLCDVTMQILAPNCIKFFLIYQVILANQV